MDRVCQGLLYSSFILALDESFAWIMRVRVEQPVICTLYLDPLRRACLSGLNHSWILALYLGLDEPSAWIMVDTICRDWPALCVDCALEVQQLLFVWRLFILIPDDPLRGLVNLTMGGMFHIRTTVWNNRWTTKGNPFV